MRGRGERNKANVVGLLCLWVVQKSCASGDVVRMVSGVPHAHEEFSVLIRKYL